MDKRTSDFIIALEKEIATTHAKKQGGTKSNSLEYTTKYFMDLGYPINPKLLHNQEDHPFFQKKGCLKTIRPLIVFCLGINLVVSFFAYEILDAPLPTILWTASASLALVSMTAFFHLGNFEIAEPGISLTYLLRPGKNIHFTWHDIAYVHATKITSSSDNTLMEILNNSNYHLNIIGPQLYKHDIDVGFKKKELRRIAPLVAFHQKKLGLRISLPYFQKLL